MCVCVCVCVCVAPRWISEQRWTPKCHITYYESHYAYIYIYVCVCVAPGWISEQRWTPKCHITYYESHLYEVHDIRRIVSSTLCMPSDICKAYYKQLPSSL